MDERTNIVDVWANNLEEEFERIRDVVESHPYVAIDTEFPGIVARPTGNVVDYNYQTIKCNVDLLKVIQLGVTFSNGKGELPKVSTWQFNFKFDLDSDMYAQNSIDFLKLSGINFEKHQSLGIELLHFGEVIMSSGLVMNEDVKWISFHGCYDFAYLLKILTCCALPHNEVAFFDLLNDFFPSLYDIKYLLLNLNIKQLSRTYSLQKISEILSVKRIGRQHQAGSDSLVTCKTFFKLLELYFDNKIDDKKYAGVIYGLGSTIKNYNPKLEDNNQHKSNNTNHNNNNYIKNYSTHGGSNWGGGGSYGCSYHSDNNEIEERNKESNNQMHMEGKHCMLHTHNNHMLSKYLENKDYQISFSKDAVKGNIKSDMLHNLYANMNQNNYNTIANVGNMVSTKINNGTYDNVSTHNQGLVKHNNPQLNNINSVNDKTMRILANSESHLNNPNGVDNIINNINSKNNTKGSGKNDNKSEVKNDGKGENISDGKGNSKNSNKHNSKNNGKNNGNSGNHSNGSSKNSSNSGGNSGCNSSFHNGGHNNSNNNNNSNQNNGHNGGNGNTHGNNTKGNSKSKGNNSNIKSNNNSREFINNSGNINKNSLETNPKLIKNIFNDIPQNPNSCNLSIDMNGINNSSEHMKNTNGVNISRNLTNLNGSTINYNNPNTNINSLKNSSLLSNLNSFNGLNSNINMSGKNIVADKSCINGKIGQVSMSNRNSNMMPNNVNIGSNGMIFSSTNNCFSVNNMCINNLSSNINVNNSSAINNGNINFKVGSGICGVNNNRGSFNSYSTNEGNTRKNESTKSSNILEENVMNSIKGSSFESDSNSITRSGASTSSIYTPIVNYCNYANVYNNSSCSGSNKNCDIGSGISSGSCNNSGNGNSKSSNKSKNNSNIGNNNKNSSGNNNGSDFFLNDANFGTCNVSNNSNPQMNNCINNFNIYPMSNKYNSLSNYPINVSNLNDKVNTKDCETDSEMYDVPRGIHIPCNGNNNNKNDGYCNDSELISSKNTLNINSMNKANIMTSMNYSKNMSSSSLNVNTNFKGTHKNNILINDTSNGIIQNGNILTKNNDLGVVTVNNYDGMNMLLQNMNMIWEDNKGKDEKINTLNKATIANFSVKHPPPPPPPPPPPSSCNVSNVMNSMSNNFSVSNNTNSGNNCNNNNANYSANNTGSGIQNNNNDKSKNNSFIKNLNASAAGNMSNTNVNNITHIINSNESKMCNMNSIGSNNYAANNHVTKHNLNSNNCNNVNVSTKLSFVNIPNQNYVSGINKSNSIGSVGSTGAGVSISGVGSISTNIVTPYNGESNKKPLDNNNDIRGNINFNRNNSNNPNKNNKNFSQLNSIINNNNVNEKNNKSNSKEGNGKNFGLISTSCISENTYNADGNTVVNMGQISSSISSSMHSISSKNSGEHVKGSSSTNINNNVNGSNTNSNSKNSKGGKNGSKSNKNNKNKNKSTTNGMGNNGSRNNGEDNCGGYPPCGSSHSNSNSNNNNNNCTGSSSPIIKKKSNENFNGDKISINSIEQNNNYGTVNQRKSGNKDFNNTVKDEEESSKFSSTNLQSNDDKKNVLIDKNTCNNFLNSMNYFKSDNLKMYNKGGIGNNTEAGVGAYRKNTTQQLTLKNNFLNNSTCDSESGGMHNLGTGKINNDLNKHNIINSKNVQNYANNTSSAADGTDINADIHFLTNMKNNKNVNNYTDILHGNINNFSVINLSKVGNHSNSVKDNVVATVGGNPSDHNSGNNSSHNSSNNSSHNSSTTVENTSDNGSTSANGHGSNNLISKKMNKESINMTKHSMVNNMNLNSIYGNNKTNTFAKMGINHKGGNVSNSNFYFNSDCSIADASRNQLYYNSYIESFSENVTNKSFIQKKNNNNNITSSIYSDKRDESNIISYNYSDSNFAEKNAILTEKYESVESTQDNMFNNTSYEFKNKERKFFL